MGTAAEPFLPASGDLDRRGSARRDSRPGDAGGPAGGAAPGGTAPSPEPRPRGWTLVHALPRRRRYRVPRLADPRIDFAWLEAHLDAVRGVHSVRVNRRARTLIVRFDGAADAPERFEQALSALGERRIPLGRAEPSAPAEIAPLLTTTLLLLALPFLSPSLRRLLTFLNVAPTLSKGLAVLLRRGIGIEVLDAVAVGLSAGRREHLTANVTQFLMELGAYLEARTESQSDRMLRRLLRPDPMLAWVEGPEGLVRIPDDQLREGDRIQVGIGERIPADGLVLGGTALVNQAAITGESVPVRKEVMDRVIAGTVLEDGRLRVEARQVGADTTTARIARFIDESLDRKAPAQRLAERLADQRVYLTLGTGALIYALTRDPRRLASIFLVDYSCALKLGTPLAFKSGIYRAATEGVLFKGGEALERLAEVDTVVFDKTGTLTRSELEVTDVLVLDEARWSRERLLAVTASIEEHASHPVAEAIVRQARQERLNHVDHGEVEYLVAHGMRCPVEGDALLIGSRHYLEAHHGLSFAPLEARARTLAEAGKTLLYVGTRREVIGVIALRDQQREETPEVLAALRTLGVRHLVMLTGDTWERARALAGALGIDEVFAQQAPEHKARVIAQLRAEGRRVAFVGDGVNDGPALVEADVGIAMSRGAELARATADVVLLEDHLGLLGEALDVARRTMGLVGSTHRLAMGINTSVILGAASGVLSPIGTALLHNGTTVGLILRALRGLEGPAPRPGVPGAPVPVTIQQGDPACPTESYPSSPAP